MAGEYEPKFFDALRAGARRSAESVVPIVHEIVQPKTVVDVGCGSASWAAAFARLGAQVAGCDGAYVLEAGLDIPEDRCVALDLENIAGCRRALPGSFDLAISMEVAEHLPPSCAEEFVGFLCDLAPVTLFSAAVPGQPGHQHVNCQWPAYWNRLFRRRDRICLDILRPLFHLHQRIEPWYRQNMLIFVDKSIHDAVLARCLERGLIQRALSSPMNFKHPASDKRLPQPRA